MSLNDVGEHAAGRGRRSARAGCRGGRRRWPWRPGRRRRAAARPGGRPACRASTPASGGDRRAPTSRRQPTLRSVALTLVEVDDLEVARHRRRQRDADDELGLPCRSRTIIVRRVPVVDHPVAERRREDVRTRTWPDGCWPTSPSIADQRPRRRRPVCRAAMIVLGAGVVPARALRWTTWALL